MSHTIVLASSNAGKLKEFNALLQTASIEVVPQSAFDVPDADENGLSFIENAILKARQAAKYTGLPAFADDSGIEVDALNGQPGIYSARFAGVHGDNAANNEKLLTLMKEVPDAQRTARFHCVIAYLKHEQDPTPIICQGTWEGRIMSSLEGGEGFGYDPLFWVPTHGCTSAQLPSAVKNSISHRAQALQKLLSYFAETA